MFHLINFADDKFKFAQKFNSKTAKKFKIFDTITEYKPENIDEAFKTKAILQRTEQSKELSDGLKKLSDESTAQARCPPCVKESLKKRNMFFLSDTKRSPG